MVAVARPPPCLASVSLVEGRARGPSAIRSAVWLAIWLAIRLPVGESDWWPSGRAADVLSERRCGEWRMLRLAGWLAGSLARAVGRSDLAMSRGDREIYMYEGRQRGPGWMGRQDLGSGRERQRATWPSSVVRRPVVGAAWLGPLHCSCFAETHSRSESRSELVCRGCYQSHREPPVGAAGPRGAGRVWPGLACPALAASYTRG